MVCLQTLQLALRLVVVVRQLDEILELIVPLGLGTVRMSLRRTSSSLHIAAKVCCVLSIAATASRRCCTSLA